MKLTHSIIPLLLIAATSCASLDDLKRLEQDTNVRQEQLRREFILLRDGVTTIQQELQRQRERKTVDLNRIEQQMARTNEAVLLMGQAVSQLAQLVEPTVATERPKSQ